MLQEKKYEAAKKLNEVAQFKFPNELSQIDNVEFEQGFTGNYEKSIQLISTAWAKLQRRLSKRIKISKVLGNPLYLQ